MEPKPRQSERASGFDRCMNVLSPAFFGLVGFALFTRGVAECFFMRSQNAWVLLLVGGIFCVISVVVYLAWQKQQVVMEATIRKQRTDLAPWLRRAEWASRSWRIARGGDVKSRGGNVRREQC
jgi:hypothetical protein